MASTFARWLIVLTVLLLPVANRAEVIEINTTREETLTVARDMLVSLSFPYRVKRVVHGPDAYVQAVEKSVFVKVKDVQSVFVMLDAGVTVPLLLVPSRYAPVSYEFRMPTPFKGEFYQEIAALVAAMYHGQDVLSYKRDTTHFKVQVSIQGGKETTTMEVVERYVGSYIGYVLKGKGKAIQSHNENEFWEPGVVAVAKDGNRLFVVASRDIFKKEETVEVSGEPAGAD